MQKRLSNWKLKCEIRFLSALRVLLCFCFFGPLRVFFLFFLVFFFTVIWVIFLFFWVLFLFSESFSKFQLIWVFFHLFLVIFLLLWVIFYFSESLSFFCHTLIFWVFTLYPTFPSLFLFFESFSNSFSQFFHINLYPG